MNKTTYDLDRQISISGMIDATRSQLDINMLIQDFFTVRFDWHQQQFWLNINGQLREDGNEQNNL